MNFWWSESAWSFFNDDNIKDEFEKLIEEKLTTYIANNYFRIKPIRNAKSSGFQLYELRVHIAKKDFRIAFAQNKEQIIICYLSEELQKQKFDKQFQKWYKHQKDELLHPRQFGK